jgi:hypothetical protein
MRCLNILSFFCLCSKLIASDNYSLETPYFIEYVKHGVDRMREGTDDIPSIKRLSNKDKILKGDFITTGEYSFTQMHHEDVTIRMGSNGLLERLDYSSWKLWEGSVLCAIEDKRSLSLYSSKGSATIGGPCTFIAETTSNGGYKFICLSGKPVVTTGDGKSKVPAGRLVLVLGETDALGNAYDIDLLLLLKSSLLINAFEEPPPTMKKIGLAIYSQQLRMGGKYDALIGDATTDKNLQMWVLGKKGSDTKPSK